MIAGFILLAMTICVAALTPLILKRQRAKLARGRYFTSGDDAPATPSGEKSKGKNTKNLQDIWGIKDIKNGLVLTDEGYYRIYLRIGSVDYHMMPGADQDSLEAALISLAMSLNVPVQLLTTTELLDTKACIAGMYNYLNEPMADSMRSYVINSIDYHDGLMQNRGNNVRRSYAVISCNKLSDYGKASAELYRRAENLISLYARAGIKAQVMDSNEIVDLLFRMLNRGRAVKPSDLVAAGGLALYKTGRDMRVVQPSEGPTEEGSESGAGNEHSETA